MCKYGKRCPPKTEFLGNLTIRCSGQADVTKHIFTTSVLQHTQSALKRIADDPGTLVADPGEWYSRRDLGHMWSMHGCQNQCSRLVLLPIIICRTTMSSVNLQTLSQWQQQGKENKHTQSEKKGKKRQRKKKKERKIFCHVHLHLPPFLCRITRIFFVDLDRYESKLKSGAVSLSRIYDIRARSMSC